MTLLSPSFILIWEGVVYGVNEGGDNNGGRLGFWWSLRPLWVSVKSQVLPEVLLVHWTCVRDKTDLIYLPVLTLWRSGGIRIGSRSIRLRWLKGYTYFRFLRKNLKWLLVCRLDLCKVPITDIWYPLWEDRYFLWLTLLDSSSLWLCEGSIHLTVSCVVPYRILRGMTL